MRHCDNLEKGFGACHRRDFALKCSSWEGGLAMNISKTVLLATTSMALLTCTARAADLSADAPVVSPPGGFDWNGFYAGVGIGYEDWSGAGAADSFNITGKIGGNVVLDMFVLGAEGYVTGYYLLGPNVWQAKWGADVRAGALITDSLLAYGFVGLFHDGNYGTPTIYGSAGAGIEFAVSDTMSLDLRYRYSVDLDTPAYTANGVSISANWHF